MKRVLAFIANYLLLVNVALAASYTVNEFEVDGYGPLIDTPPEVVAPFHAVKVTGNVDLMLVTNPNEYALDIDGTERAVQRTKVSVVNDTLVISAPRGQAINAVVYSPNLHEVVYVGSGQISGSGIKSPLLELSVSNAERVNLNGQIGLKKLTVKRVPEVAISGVDSHHLELDIDNESSVLLRGKTALDYLVIAGNGRVDIDRIRTRYLDITAEDNAHITLSGRVDLLEVTLNKQAFFDGKNLQVKDGYIKTFDNSTASIQVERLQNAAAKGTSNIYYYRKPQFTATYMEKSGSVLFIEDHYRSRYLRRAALK